MPKNTQAAAQQTRRRILDAAETVFCSEGYAAATLQRIAEQAGVTRGGVYGHFTGKEAMLSAVLASRRVPLEAIDNAVGLAGRYEQLTRAIVATTTIHECWRLQQVMMQVLIEKTASTAARNIVRRRTRLILKQLARHIDAMVTAAVDTGELSAEHHVGNTAARSMALQKSISGLVCDLVILRDRPSREPYVRRLMQLIFLTHFQYQEDRQRQPPQCDVLDVGGSSGATLQLHESSGLSLHSSAA